MLRHTVLLIGVLIQVVSAKYVYPVFVEDVIPGTRQSRIVSGWEARPGQHPHQVSLRMVNGTGSVTACGGSVIHREWIVTSAHCTAGRITIVVRAGVTALSRPEYLFESNEWYNHPTYNDLLPQIVQPNDISLLKLQRRLVYTEYLRPIRVQPSADAYRDYGELRLYASGFGVTWTAGPQPEILNWVYLTGVTNANCRGTFGTIVTDTTICARFYNVTSQSICQGDSGGPLVYEDWNGEPILIGVSSFVAGGNWGCHSGLPGAFVRPGPFLSWFTQITGIDFENLVEEEETTTAAPTTTTTTTTTPPPTTTTDLPINTTTVPPVTTTEAPPGENTTVPSPTTTTAPPINTTTVEPSTTTVAPPTNTTTGPTTTISDESDSDEVSSEEDPEQSELYKKMALKVKVKVMLTKIRRKKL